MKRRFLISLLNSLVSLPLPLAAAELPANLNFLPDNVSLADREKLFSQLPAAIREFVIATPAVIRDLESKNVVDPNGNVAGPNCHTVAIGWHDRKVLELKQTVQLTARYTIDGKKSVDQAPDISLNGRRYFLSEQYMNQHLKVLWSSGILAWDKVDPKTLADLLADATKKAQVQKGDILQIVAIEDGVQSIPDGEDNLLKRITYLKQDVQHSAVLLDSNWLFEKRDYASDTYRIEALNSDLAKAWLDIYKPRVTRTGSSENQHAFLKVKFHILRFENN